MSFQGRVQGEVYKINQYLISPNYLSLWGSVIYHVFLLCLIQWLSFLIAIKSLLA